MAAIYFAISRLANRRGGTREIMWVCGTAGDVADRCKCRVIVGGWANDYRVVVRGKGEMDSFLSVWVDFQPWLGRSFFLGGYSIS
jgi:hypothetical protein